MGRRHLSLPKLGSLAPGIRIVKTALAVGLAWWIATLFGEPRPVFAAIGALVGMEPTVVGSLRRTALQSAGIVGGLALAFLVGRLMGINALAAALAVLLGIWLGRWVGSPERIGAELSITALLVVAFAPHDPEFGINRLWESALGGLTATVVNALVLPPSYLGQVAEDFDALAREIADGLRDAMHIFVERPEHEGAAETLERLRAVHASLPDLEARLGLAREALRLSPLVRDQAVILSRYGGAVPLYGRAVNHTSALARTVHEHAARPHPWSHTGLVGRSHPVRAADALALTLEHYVVHLRTGATGSLADVRRELARARAALAAFFEVAEHERAADTPIQRLVDIAAVATELGHLEADFAYLEGGRSTQQAGQVSTAV